MLRVGLTGGTACGKSTVAQMFAARPGVQVLDADTLVRELYRPGSTIAARVAQEFGAGLLDSSGAVDRRRLADLVFHSPEKLQRLEAIVHPAVIEREHAWMRDLEKQQPEAIAMVEATKMLEAGSYAAYDRVVLVTCTPRVQLQRFLMRHPEIGAQEAGAELERRALAQFSDAQRRSLVPPDLVIDNSGSREQTEAQVETIYRRLRTETSSVQRVK